MMYIKLAVLAVFLALASTSYYLYNEVQDYRTRLRDSNAALESVSQAKIKSEKAQLDLSKQIGELNATTTERIVEVERIVRDDSESCVSPVLRESLK